MKAIVGRLEKQAWVRKDTLTVLEVVGFDATEAVMAMTLEQIRALEDCQQSTDQIGRLYVDHRGPYSVYLTGSICECFGLIDLDEITAELFHAERQAWESLPKRRFTVTIQRIAYCEAERSINARSESEAKRAALELAGDIDFSNPEHHAEYSVTSIS